MKENKGTLAAVAALLPALIIAATGWMEADAQKAKKYDALESYREYIEDRMSRDDALEKALNSCLFREQMCLETRGGTTFAVPSAGGPHVPDVDLDEVAEEFGYEQKVAPK